MGMGIGTKKSRLWMVGLAAIILLGAGLGIVYMWSPKTEPSAASKEDPLLEEESRKSFDFFWLEANTDKESPGYGLIRDRAPGNPNMSSVASVGFGLTAIAIGAERGWVDEDEARERAEGTLDTLLNDAAQEHGFFYHFLNMSDGSRSGTSEVSIIDTALALNGAIVAGEYFQGEIAKKAEALYRRVEWEWYRNPDRNQFYMAYSPENGFAGAWDFYAEQLSLYVLASGSPTHPTDPAMFYSFTRDSRAYGEGEPFIHSWFGSLFTHQFSHAWFDFRGMTDQQGVDWWKNSVTASKANLQYAIDQSAVYPSLGSQAWGFTASDGPDGYEGRYGAPPSGFDNDQHMVDGTVPPAGAAGSIVFTPEESFEALRYYKTLPELWGDYGFKDAFNLEVKPAWYDADVIGIDKGITLLMLENYRSGFVWEQYMKNAHVQAGAQAIGLKKE
ncbi:glucoamylase family protein [Paenibacillus silvisoli]|uniref:glucoamylase family protein n=1 Tax=Paenibacillus silvisoli TaxID=3110539 RepID=UPI0028054D0F|nr:glucoamylase family protein [Paenibacillus silvisoli]